MSLTERYVYAVTKHLPQSQREDVAKELRASIEDMASDRSKNGKPTDHDVKEVLIELGDPAILAGKYSNGLNYVIGPKWFTAYWALLKQLLTFVPAIVTVVVLTVKLIQNDTSIIQTILHSVGAGLGTAVQIGFWVTLVFAILERSGTARPEDLKDLNAKEVEWTPEQLPFPPKKRQVPAIEAWTSVGLMVAAIAWIALSPFWNTREGHTLFDPSLANFWLPTFFILAVLATIHKAFLAKIGNWTTTLVATNILLGIAGIAFVVGIVTNSTVINLDFLATLDMGQDVTPEKLAEWSRWTVGISAAAFIATYIWEMIDSVIKNRQLKK